MSEAGSRSQRPAVALLTAMLVVHNVHGVALVPVCATSGAASSSTTAMRALVAAYILGILAHCQVDTSSTAAH